MVVGNQRALWTGDQLRCDERDILVGNTICALALCPHALTSSGELIKSTSREGLIEHFCDVIDASS